MSNSRIPKPVVRRDPETQGTFTVTFADGRVITWLDFAAASELARRVAQGEDLDTVEVDLFGGEEEWVPTCSLCDAVGHGYPGAGPCPLEEHGHEDAEADRQRYGSY